MTPYLSIFLLFCLLSCTSNTDPKSNNLIANLARASLSKDTLLQNGILIVQGRKSDRLINVLTISRDTIVKQADYYKEISFHDINQDGYNDIQIEIVSNTPNECESYFFDSNNCSYRRIENAYLLFENVKGTTNLYYSYNRAGCADRNWESHLNKMENWTEVSIGRIYMKGCGEKDDGLFIYRIMDGKEYLVSKQSTDSNRLENKWDFIERYWRTKYKAFL